MALKKVLSYDISSTTIGWSYLEFDDVSNDIFFKDAGFIKPVKSGSIVERLFSTREKVVEIINKVKPDYIGIEDIVQFMAGASTAKTIIMLTTFNRMIALCCHDYFVNSGSKQLPELFSVMSIRHGIKVGDFPSKEDIPVLVSKHLNIEFPYIYNKKKNVAVESFDVADGIAVGLYYSMILTGKKKRVKEKKAKKKGKK